MIFKNLFRQKGRTFLTIFGISIGVAAIVGLGALADGLKAGYDSILSGSKADLILAHLWYAAGLEDFENRRFASAQRQLLAS